MDNKENKENNSNWEVPQEEVKKPKSKSSGRYFKVLVVLLLLVAFLGGRNLLMYKSHWSQLKESFNNSLQQRLVRMGIEEKRVEEEKSNIVLPQSIIAEEEVVTQVVEKSAPAVVSVIITKDMPKIDSFFFNPFGSNNYFYSPYPDSGGTEKVEIGGGSGFIVSEKGLVITNRHVVSDADAQYTVLTNDGMEYEAQVLDRDTLNDIAVLKINPQKPSKGKGVDRLTVLPLGDSDNIKLGQTVIAIGNSLGEFSNTISKGIVSGLRRNITAGGYSGVEELSELIQTDAAINEGNSGGPLINLRGEVIGINVAVAQGAENIGFALPVNTVKGIITSVENNGKIVRPYLGVRYVVVNDAIQQRNNLPYDYGALVQRGSRIGDLAVIPDSPADKAGLEENDIILEVEGEKVKENTDLSRLISNYKIGEDIKLKVWSKGSEKEIYVKLEEAPRR